MYFLTGASVDPSVVYVFQARAEYCWLRQDMFRVRVRGLFNAFAFGYTDSRDSRIVADYMWTKQARQTQYEMT